jgi:hypothetical protein
MAWFGVRSRGDAGEDAEKSKHKREGRRRIHALARVARGGSGEAEQSTAKRSGEGVAFRRG